MPETEDELTALDASIKWPFEAFQHLFSNLAFSAVFISGFKKIRRSAISMFNNFFSYWCFLKKEN